MRWEDEGAGRGAGTPQGRHSLRLGEAEEWKKDYNLCSKVTLHALERTALAHGRVRED